jgi:hypothetical protein
VNETSKEPPAPIVTLSLAEQVRSLPVKPQLIALLLVMLTGLVTDSEL